MVSFVKANMRDAFDNIQTFKTDVENSNISNVSNVSSSAKSETASLIDELIAKFAKSFAKSSGPDETVDDEAKYIVNTFDKDKDGTVSLSELKNSDSSQMPADVQNKISDLESNFKIYDKDGSGELDVAEVKNAIGKNQYSQQELKAMASEDASQSDSDSSGSGLIDSQSHLFMSAANSYKKVDSATAPHS